MITEIRLLQIKDTYNGNEDVLIPLIKLLKESPSKIAPFKIEFIVVYKSLEWVRELQVYEPFPIFSYLVRAYKLAFPSSTEQSHIYINALVSSESSGQLSDVQKKILIESSKLKVLISMGERFITNYADNIIRGEKSSSQLSMFAELVNNAGVDNDTK
jgi:hypothetical protein